VVAAAPGTRDRSLTGLRRRWTIAFVVGELVGFVPPALTGVTLAALGVSDAALVAGMVAAGMLEGAAIGVAQGMGGVALVQASGPGAWVVVGPGMVAGLFAMGILQWRVLRRHLPRSSRWVWVTSGAWLVGVMIPVAALSVVPDGWPPAARVVVAVGAAVAMGATVGLLTGGTLVSLLRRREREVDAHGAEA
jgi:hypothetical protein